MSRYGTLRPNMDHIDHKTARSICDEVGDRLQLSKLRLYRPTSNV
jgi:hypothetical protein